MVYQRECSRVMCFNTFKKCAPSLSLLQTETMPRLKCCAHLNDNSGTYLSSQYFWWNSKLINYLKGSNGLRDRNNQRIGHLAPGTHDLLMWFARADWYYMNTVKAWFRHVIAIMYMNGVGNHVPAQVMLAYQKIYVCKCNSPPLLFFSHYANIFDVTVE